MNLFGPEIVLLGGYMADAPGELLGSLADEVRKDTFPLQRAGFRIARPRVGNPMVAAAAASLEHVLYR